MTLLISMFVWVLLGGFLAAISQGNLLIQLCALICSARGLYFLFQFFKGDEHDGP